MRQYIGTHTEELRNYLKEEFGDLQECCGVMAPPAGSIVDIIEPLQTCHKSCGQGLENKCIPICTLIVGKLISGRTSNFMEAIKIPENTPIRFEAGSAYQNCIDWRGAKKHKPTNK